MELIINAYQDKKTNKIASETTICEMNEVGRDTWPGIQINNWYFCLFALKAYTKSFNSLN